MSLAIKKNVTIDVPHLTADEWQLYTSEGYVAISRDAALKLNKSLSLLVNAQMTPETVFGAMMERMTDLRKSGSADTEPRGVLLDLIEKIYGQEARSRCW